MYFWRTTPQQGVDLVEVGHDHSAGFEFKWNANRKIRFPKTFHETYQAVCSGVTPETMDVFLGTA